MKSSTRLLCILSSFEWKYGSIYWNPTVFNVLAPRVPGVYTWLQYISPDENHLLYIVMGLDNSSISNYKNIKNYGYYLAYRNKNGDWVDIMDTTEPSDGLLLKKVVPQEKDRLKISYQLINMLGLVLQREGYPDKILRGPFTNNKMEKTRYIKITEKFRELGYIDKVEVIEGQTYIIHTKKGITKATSSIELNKEHMLYLKNIYNCCKYLGKNWKRDRTKLAAEIRKQIESEPWPTWAKYGEKNK